MITAAVAFGISPMIAAYATASGLSAIMLAFLRHILAVPVFLIIAVIGHHSLRSGRTQLRKILILAATGGALNSALLFPSYSMIGIGLATALNFTYPAFVLIAGMLFYKERISSRIWLCLALCTAGIIMMCDFSGAWSFKGFLLALGSGAAYGTYTLYIDKSRIMNEVDFVSYSFYYFLFSSIMLLPVLLIMRDAKYPTIGIWAVHTVMHAAITLYGTLASQKGIPLAGSQKASLLCSIEPATSVILGIVFLNEALDPVHITGVILVLISTVLIARSNNKGTIR